MGSLDPVVLPFRLVMPGGETELAKGRGVGSPLVSDDCPWRETMLFQKFTHQLQRGFLVAFGGYEEVEHLAILVDRAPQIHPATADRDVHLVQVPLRVSSWPSLSKTSRNLRAEPLYPPTNSLVRNFDAPFSHKFLDVTKAQVVPGIQPNGALDDRWWKVEVAVADRVHSVSLPSLADKAHRSL